MERPITIGVVAVAYGPTYRSFLPRWSTAVAELHRQPDAVTIVTDDPSCPYVTEARESLGAISLAIKARGTFTHHPQVLINEAIELSPTEWICKIDIDDVIYPHALTPLDNLDADVLMFGIRYGAQDLVWQGVTAEKILRREANLVFSGSPFRRELWESNPFRDMVFEDWAFWIGCAKQGARFASSGRVDYRYTIHDQQISQRSDAAYWTEVVRRLP